MILQQPLSGAGHRNKAFDPWSHTLNMQPLILLVYPRSICFYFCLSPVFFLSYLKNEDDVQITQVCHLYPQEVLCFLSNTSSRAPSVWEEIPRVVDTHPLSNSLCGDPNSSSTLYFNTLHCRVLHVGSWDKNHLPLPVPICEGCSLSCPL